MIHPAIKKWCADHQIQNYKLVGNVLEITGNLVFLHNEFATSMVRLKVVGNVSIHIGSLDNIQNEINVVNLDQFFSQIDGTLSLTVYLGIHVTGIILPKKGCKRTLLYRDSPDRSLTVINFDQTEVVKLGGSARVFAESLPLTLKDAPRLTWEIAPGQYNQRYTSIRIYGLRCNLYKDKRDKGFMNLVLALPKITCVAPALYERLMLWSGINDWKTMSRVDDMLTSKPSNELDPFEIQEFLINSGYTDAATLI